jgi:hypothetical protein
VPVAETQTGRESNDLLNPVSVARGKIGPDGNFTNQYGEAGSGDMVRIIGASGNKTILPWEDYQKFTKQKKPTESPGTETDAAEPEPTPIPGAQQKKKKYTQEQINRAWQAMSHPAATEDERAAARRLLVDAGEIGAE